jgi:uncharacterized protein
MSYRVEVRTLLSTLSASRTVSGQLELSDVEMGEQVFHFEGPVSFEITLTNAGAGVVASGEVTGVASTPCVRCLCDTHLTVTAEVDGFYVLPSRANELPEEQDFELIADDLSVDLEPAVTQSLIVELPYAPVHDEACKGICPVCGADRNVEECACEPASVPSPFDKLKDLRLEGDDKA